MITKITISQTPAITADIQYKPDHFITSIAKHAKGNADAYNAFYHIVKYVQQFQGTTPEQLFNLFIAPEFQRTITKKTANKRTHACRGIFIHEEDI